MSGVVNTKGKVFAVLALLLILGLPIEGRAGGHIASQYDLVNDVWKWEIEVNGAVLPWLRVGTTLGTVGDRWIMKTVVPSFVPELQEYKLWAEAHFGSITVRLTDWCAHPLRQAGPAYDLMGNGLAGLDLRVQYNF